MMPEHTIKTITIIAGTVFFFMSLLTILVMEIFHRELSDEPLGYIAVTWLSSALIFGAWIATAELLLTKYRGRQNLTLIVVVLASMLSVANMLFGFGLFGIYNYSWENTAVFGIVLTLITWAFVTLLSTPSGGTRSQIPQVPVWYCTGGHQVPDSFLYCPHCGMRKSSAPTIPLQHPPYP